jgi:hypothetical protein
MPASANGIPPATSEIERSIQLPALSLTPSRAIAVRTTSAAAADANGSAARTRPAIRARIDTGSVRR